MSPEPAKPPSSPPPAPKPPAGPDTGKPPSGPKVGNFNDAWRFPLVLLAIVLTLGTIANGVWG